MNRLFLLKRSLIRCNGTSNEASNFLQGIITNDMKLFSEQNCIYTLFLNKLGRILYDSIIYKLPANVDEEKFIIECDTAIADNLMRHLKFYRIRKKVDISLSDEHNIWFLSDSKKNIEYSNNVMPYIDPRISDFGTRLITSKDFNLKEMLNESLGSDEDYMEHRYKLGIGEGIVDLIPEKSFPLESNCDYMKGISFQKGCYIGQELTARTYHTGVVRKRLMPLIFEKKIVMNLNDNVDIKNEGKLSVGKLRNISGNYGLGLMRLEQTISSKSLNYNENPCTTEKPFWWPN
ncbi:putative transferase CAF17 homolog, mitochondrial [Chironomus tepperi]|uniref:putative transferase CAF17 homolog, mitochondrial n=1 Tax=Chironomus tepperi TaxID=113505 RepID=UPI00391F9E0A